MPLQIVARDPQQFSTILPWLPCSMIAVDSSQLITLLSARRAVLQGAAPMQAPPVMRSLFNTPMGQERSFKRASDWVQVRASPAACLAHGMFDPMHASLRCQLRLLASCPAPLLAHDLGLLMLP